MCHLLWAQVPNASVLLCHCVSLCVTVRHYVSLCRAREGAGKWHSRLSRTHRPSLCHTQRAARWGRDHVWGRVGPRLCWAACVLAVPGWLHLWVVGSLCRCVPSALGGCRATRCRGGTCARGPSTPSALGSLCPGFPVPWVPCALGFPRVFLLPGFALGSLCPGWVQSNPVSRGARLMTGCLWFLGSLCHCVPSVLVGAEQPGVTVARVRGGHQRHLPPPDGSRCAVAGRRRYRPGTPFPPHALPLSGPCLRAHPLPLIWCLTLFSLLLCCLALSSLLLSSLTLLPLAVLSGPALRVPPHLWIGSARSWTGGCRSYYGALLCCTFRSGSQCTLRYGSECTFR